uniref:Uncharacterized protein n=1 Tax=Arcella intermedia TaxID=1963864 RepID=A0A6B2LJ14_9EUKA
MLKETFFLSIGHIPFIFIEHASHRHTWLQGVQMICRVRSMHTTQRFFLSSSSFLRFFSAFRASESLLRSSIERTDKLLKAFHFSSSSSACLRAPRRPFSCPSSISILLESLSIFLLFTARSSAKVLSKLRTPSAPSPPLISCTNSNNFSTFPLINSTPLWFFKVSISCLVFTKSKSLSHSTELDDIES